MVIGVAARPRALLQWEVDYIGLDRYQETHGRVNRTHKLATREPIHTGGINLGYIAAQSLRKFRSLIGHQGIVSLLNSLQYYFPFLHLSLRLNFNSLWSRSLLCRWNILDVMYTYIIFPAYLQWKFPRGDFPEQRLSVPPETWLAEN